MGSVGFDTEDEFQPSTSNGKKYRLPRTVKNTDLLDLGGAVNHASVPRKLRSASKKRGHESVTPTLPISRKHCHETNGFETLGKDGGKKLKLNMKQGHITKDEEEVAETLYALADMFSDANKVRRPGLNSEPPEAKSSATIEDAGILTLKEESRKIDSEFPIDAAQNSSNLNSTGKVVKFQSLDDVQQPELPTSKLPATSTASGNQSRSLGPRLRVSSLHMIPSGEQGTVMEQVAASRIQYDKNYYPMDDKNKGLFLLPSLSARGTLSSKTPGSCPRHPESTSSAYQPLLIENGVTAEKQNRVLDPVDFNKSWKRCSAHVYISRLIKVLQVSDRKEGLLEKPTQITPCGGEELQTHGSSHSRTMGITGRNGGVSFSGITHSAAVNESTEIQNGIHSHKRPLQDQQLASETSGPCSSRNQGYDFLSLGTGVCGLDASEGINSRGQGHGAPTQFHASYVQSQSHASMLFSLPQSGYSSTFHGHNSALAAQQVQLPQYQSTTINSSFTAQLGQQLESQQQKWTAQLPTQYISEGVGAPQLSDWKIGARDSRTMLNYAHILFPHLHADLVSEYQQFSPPQQQLVAINSSQSSLAVSNLKRHQHHFSLGFERNVAAFYPENMRQFQLSCNQHLSS